MPEQQRVSGGKGTFGALVESLRKEREWSISRLSQEAKLSSTRIVDIEKMEEPKVFGETMGKLAKAFGLDVQELRKRYEAARKKSGGRFADEGPIVLDEAWSKKVRELAAKDGIEPTAWVMRALSRYAKGTDRRKDKLRITTIDATNPDNVTLTRDEIHRPNPK